MHITQTNLSQYILLLGDLILKFISKCASKHKSNNNRKYIKKKKIDNSISSSSSFNSISHARPRMTLKKTEIETAICVCVCECIFVTNENFIIFWLYLKDFSVYLFKFLIFDFNSWAFTETEHYFFCVSKVILHILCVWYFRVYLLIA